MRVAPPGAGDDHARAGRVPELFTDRESESRVFKTTLQTFRRYLDSETDTGEMRRNLLVLHGLGGIGKTALSHRLEAWVKGQLPLDNGWGARPLTTVAATSRIDFHGSSGEIDFLSTLLALRSGFASARRQWRIFDLAFAAYWTAVRPGEEFPKFRDRDELTSAVTETLADVLIDVGSVADITGVGTGVGVGMRGIRKLVSEVRRRRNLRLAMNSFDGFEDFLVRCADEPSPTDPRPELICELAAALAWELANLDVMPLVVTFIDTAERVSLDPRRVSEGLLNRLIHRMPNVLFVITGRDMLDWYDSTRIDLPYRGPIIWPGLVPGNTEEEPKQHLVGNLSSRDAKTLILKARRQLDLPMTDEVIDQLVAASAGLPVYLELARQVAITIKSAGDGRSVRVGDVTGSLGTLVQRILDDVPSDEQRAIRAACLFRSFDLDLMAGAADVDYGCAARAVERPMIEHYVNDRWPYRMHDAVREAIRRADHRVHGGWSERDWEAAASRAARIVHRLHDDAKERGDQVEVLNAVGIAICLVCEQDTQLERSTNEQYADWLTQAIVYGPSIQGLRPRIPASSQTEYGRFVIYFVAGKSLDTPLGTRLELLRRVFDSDHPLKIPAGRHLGYALKNDGRWDEALDVFREVTTIAPTPINLGQPPQLLSLARRFIEARDEAAGTSTGALITRVAEYCHGQPGRYFAEIEEKVQKIRSQGRIREVLEDQGTLLLRRSLLRDDVESVEIEQFLAEAESVGHVVAIRDALAATVVHHQVTTAETSTILSRLKALDSLTAIGGGITYRYAIAAFCDALLADSYNDLERLRNEASLIPVRSRTWIPLEMFFEAIKLPLAPMPTQWLEARQVVLQRWTAHLDAYLVRHGEVPVSQRVY
jgi:hypothetical protein